MRGYLECLTKYSTFSGRSQRREYWNFVLVNAIVLVALTVIEMVARGDAAGNNGSVLASLYNLAMFLPGLAAGVRRMHDTNHRGWWLIVPVVNLVFACMNGEPGDNRFGPDPKAAGLSVDPSRWAAARA
jgi:uncharacterized membrane protein YhaH (DUF805 family)